MSWTHSVGEHAEEEGGKKRNLIPLLLPQTCTSKMALDQGSGSLSCCCANETNEISGKQSRSKLKLCFLLLLLLCVKWNCRPPVHPWSACDVSVGQVVCAYGCSVANGNEQPGWLALRSIDRTLSHRRLMEIGPGGGSEGGAHMPTPSVDTYGHRDQHTCTYWESERAYVSSFSVCARVCVGWWVAVCVYWCPWVITAHWTEDNLLIGDSMEHIDETTCSVGFSLPVLQKKSWISSTSPHVPSLSSPHTRTVSNQVVGLPLLLHCHKNECQISIYCVSVAVGKSLRLSLAPRGNFLLLKQWSDRFWIS